MMFDGGFLQETIPSWLAIAGHGFNVETSSMRPYADHGFLQETAPTSPATSVHGFSAETSWTRSSSTSYD